MPNPTNRPRKKAAGQPPVTLRWLLHNAFGLLRQFGGRILVYAFLVYCVHEARLALVAFAGTTSIASLFFDVAAHVNLTIAVSISVAGISGALWVNEVRRHLKTRERLTKRITELEKRLDPKRTSSKLTSKGTTAPGDQ